MPDELVNVPDGSRGGQSCGILLEREKECSVQVLFQDQLVLVNRSTVKAAYQHPYMYVRQRPLVAAGVITAAKEEEV